MRSTAQIIADIKSQQATLRNSKHVDLPPKIIAADLLLREFLDSALAKTKFTEYNEALKLANLALKVLGKNTAPTHNNEIPLHTFEIANVILNPARIPKDFDAEESAGYFECLRTTAELADIFLANNDLSTSQRYILTILGIAETIMENSSPKNVRTLQELNFLTVSCKTSLVKHFHKNLRSLRSVVMATDQIPNSPAFNILFVMLNGMYQKEISYVKQYKRLPEYTNTENGKVAKHFRPLRSFLDNLAPTPPDEHGISKLFTDTERDIIPFLNAGIINSALSSLNTASWTVPQGMVPFIKKSIVDGLLQYRATFVQLKGDLVKADELLRVVSLAQLDADEAKKKEKVATKDKRKSDKKTAAEDAKRKQQEEAAILKAEQEAKQLEEAEQKRLAEIKKVRLREETKAKAALAKQQAEELRIKQETERKAAAALRQEEMAKQQRFSNASAKMATMSQTLLVGQQNRQRQLKEAEAAERIEVVASDIFRSVISGNIRALELLRTAQCNAPSEPKASESFTSLERTIKSFEKLLQIRAITNVALSENTEKLLLGALTLKNGARIVAALDKKAKTELELSKHTSGLELRSLDSESQEIAGYLLRSLRNGNADKLLVTNSLQRQRNESLDTQEQRMLEKLITLCTIVKPQIEEFIVTQDKHGNRTYTRKDYQIPEGPIADKLNNFMAMRAGDPLKRAGYRAFNELVIEQIKPSQKLNPDAPPFNPPYQTHSRSPSKNVLSLVAG